MPFLKSKMDYDFKFDILYCCILNTDNSYGDEIDDIIVILRDIETEQVTGVTIIGYKKYFQGNIEEENKLNRYLCDSLAKEICRYQPH